MLTIEENLKKALELQKKGNLADATAIYFQVLENQPNNINALRLLSKVSTQIGKHSLALNLLEKAIALNNLTPELHHDRGLILEILKKPNEAIVCYQKAIDIDPSFFSAYINLGKAFEKEGKFLEAIDYYQKAIKLKPDYADVYNQIGVLWMNQSKLKEAIPFFQRALEINPSYFEANCNFGNISYHTGNFTQAIQCYERAIQIKPQDVTVNYNLGRFLYENGNLAKAIPYFQKVIQIEPNHARAYNNLGSVYKDQGKINESIAYYRKAIQIQPIFHEAHSNLLFILNHDPCYDNEMLFQEHLAWAKQHVEPIIKINHSHINNRDPNRRLKIGYVSGDFYKHVGAQQFQPFLSEHNRTHFEIFCYSNVLKPDRTTQYLKSLADHWRNIQPLSDQTAAKLIQEDRIDILIDLNGHTSGNRLLLFAYKPAPVQASYIGYVNTTGLTTIDYRLTDIHGDPPGMTETYYTEKHIRLPDTALCFQPHKESPSISPLPALISHQITFGSSNNLAKINTDVLDLWSKVLESIPKSKLIIKAKSLEIDEIQKSIRERFSNNGIDPKRLELRGWSSNSHFNFYQEIDIHLDSFPFTGGMTSYDSLWMGVPVTTLAGHHFVSRMSVRFLANLGLHCWIAKTQEEYVKIAIQMSQDLDKLSILRKELRGMILNSPLSDGKRITRNLEKAYHQMWQKWCKQVKR